MKWKILSFPNPAQVLHACNFCGVGTPRCPALTAYPSVVDRNRHHCSLSSLSVLSFVNIIPFSFSFVSCQSWRCCWRCSGWKQGSQVHLRKSRTSNMCARCIVVHIGHINWMQALRKGAAMSIAMNDEICGSSICSSGNIRCCDFDLSCLPATDNF